MKKLTVDGITFNSSKEAKEAAKELEAIEKIREHMDVTKPAYAKVLCRKLEERKLFHTKVGDKFMEELHGYFEEESFDLDEPETVQTGSVNTENPGKVEETAVGDSVEEPELSFAKEIEEPELSFATGVAEPELSFTTEAEELEVTAEKEAAEFKTAAVKDTVEPEITAAEPETAAAEEELTPQDVPEQETAFTEDHSDIDGMSAEEEMKQEDILAAVMEAAEAEEAAEDEEDLSDLISDEELLENAKTLKEEMHREDLREIFSEEDKDTAKEGKTRFSLYGLLAASLVFNVALILAIVLMYHLFSASDNVNILNYERILNQTVQENLATATDAE